MKKLVASGMAGWLLSTSALAWAASPKASDAPYAIDSDLSAPGGPRIQQVPLDLSADESEIETLDDADTLEISVFRESQGVSRPVVGLPFKAADQLALTGIDGVARFSGCQDSGQPLEIVATLDDGRHFSVTGDGRSAYRIRAHAGCGSRVNLRFREDSDGGQATGIWQIAERARRKLNDSRVGVTFWNRKLSFVWPDSADYYSWGSVHVSRGDHWDVVGHELGHGIYDLAGIGGFGGGEHKIDECYSATLAFSEGWASYFSAWLSIALDDADAKFEHMVPRRAPIRFETIPSDVCQGQGNEWRVTGFLWDLIDLNDDGESAGEPFARVWRALAGSRANSAGDVATALERAGFDPALVDIAWMLNFQSPR